MTRRLSSRSKFLRRSRTRLSRHIPSKKVLKLVKVDDVLYDLRDNMLQFLPNKEANLWLSANKDTRQTGCEKRTCVLDIIDPKEERTIDSVVANSPAFTHTYSCRNVQGRHELIPSYLFRVACTMFFRLKGIENFASLGVVLSIVDRVFFQVRYYRGNIVLRVDGHMGGFSQAGMGFDPHDNTVPYPQNHPLAQGDVIASLFGELMKGNEDWFSEAFEQAFGSQRRRAATLTASGSWFPEHRQIPDMLANVAESLGFARATPKRIIGCEALFQDHRKDVVLHLKNVSARNVGT